MEVLILNGVTVALTSCILPLLLRFVLKRPLGKLAALAVVIANCVLMAVAWVMVRDLILGEVANRPGSNLNYITYGIGFAALVSWGILTSGQSSEKEPV